MLGGLLGDALRRAHRADGQTVTPLERVPELDGLGKEQPGIECEDVDGDALAGDCIDDDAALGPEGGCEADPAREPGARVAQDRFERSAVEFRVCGGNLPRFDVR